MSFVAPALAWLGVRPVPHFLTFEITHRCNLACAYCDRHTPRPRELDLPLILRLLAAWHALGTRRVGLDGGEPLTHPHIAEVVDWLVDRDVPTKMNSNGILVPGRLATVRRLAGLKVSLDGPRALHDRLRGEGSHRRALRGIRTALDAGVPVELTCVVGRHNGEHLDALLDLAEELGVRVVFQPARPALLGGVAQPGAAHQLETVALRRAFARLARAKRAGRAVGNRWSSLRHFRRFPDDVALPCQAGWISVTMDPEGFVHACGQLDRQNRAHDAVRLGVRAAFAGLVRRGCRQCWCARVVEGNYAWGLRVDRMVPLRLGPDRDDERAAPPRDESRRGGSSEG